MRAWECKPQRSTSCVPTLRSIRRRGTLRRWPTAWLVGSFLLILTAATAQAASEHEIARAVDGFVAALSSGSVAWLANVDSEEVRDLIVSSECVTVHSYRVKTEVENENEATVALDLVAIRVLRS